MERGCGTSDFYGGGICRTCVGSVGRCGSRGEIGGGADAPGDTEAESGEDSGQHAAMQGGLKRGVEHRPVISDGKGQAPAAEYKGMAAGTE